jgi:alkyldihydroxyacetonephosphate synthase
MGDDRARSFWGWGWADKFPDDDTRRGIAAQVCAILGLAEGSLRLRPPPSLESVRMPSSRVGAPAQLAAFTTAERRDRAMHTYGKSYRDIVRAFGGDFSPAPDLVSYPRTEEEVSAVLAFCSNEGIAAIPFGGGTSVVSGVEAPAGARGAVSIDLRAFDRVLEIDHTSRAARIQAGVYGPALEKQLAVHGLTLRHFPQSFEFSTLGGWIATRAGGHFATVYTHIDDLVEAVRMVTPKGVLETRRLPASGAGPQPERLVLGSEGTLGIITEAWMRVHARPRWRASASVRFEGIVEGARAARAIAQAALYPTNCRLLDAREAMLNGVPTEGGAVLLLGFESDGHPRDAWMDRALALAIENGGRALGPVKVRVDDKSARDAAGESWRQAFIDAPYLQSTLVSLGVVADTFETACTWDRFESLHAAVTSAVADVMQRLCGGGSITCRFTHVYPDGPAPYFTFVAPGRQGEELAMHEAIKRAASDALIANGATITHHHAVGRLHRPWYDRERPDLFAEALRAAKRALDPAAVLNPGVLIDV